MQKLYVHGHDGLINNHIHAIVHIQLTRYPVNLLNMDMRYVLYVLNLRTSMSCSPDNLTVVSWSQFIDRSNPHTVLCGQVQTSDI